jgi:V8-like Glu-specific endopeptidase
MVALIALAAAPVEPIAASHEDQVLVNEAGIGGPPFDSVVLLSVGGRVACTGFVIGTRRVATAAHCLTRGAEEGDYRLREGLPGNVVLYRGYSHAAGGTSYPTCRAARAWAHPRFVRRGASDARFGERDHDYAVLTTTPDCTYPKSAILRLWPTEYQDGQLAVGQGIAMTGYPSDLRFSGMNGLNMWRSRGHLQSAFGDPLRLFVTGFVGHGMSGSPVWRTFADESPCGRRHCVIGIVTECAVNGASLCRLRDSFRRAVRVTRTVKEDLRNH